MVAGALPATPRPYGEEGRRGDAGASARSGRAAEDGLVKEKALKVGGWPRTGHFHKPLKGLRHDKPAQERLCGQMGPSRGPQLATGAGPPAGLEGSATAVDGASARGKPA